MSGPSSMPQDGPGDEELLASLAADLGAPATPGRLHAWQERMMRSDDPGAAMRRELQPIFAALVAHEQERYDDVELLLGDDPDRIWSAFHAVWLLAQLAARQSQLPPSEMFQQLLDHAASGSL